MAFVDELRVHMRAGSGGDGVIRWRHEKGKNLAGASGGNGGKGGDIYALGSRDLSLLSRYRNTKEFKGAPGGSGMKNSRHGENGKDLYVEVPVGSIIRNEESGYTVEITSDGEKKLLLSGGRGGLGNEHFKSSKNTTPKQFTLGDLGESADFKIELQLIADAGLIGLPNAGKSSLLNVLTKAKAKVGSYAFTTLEPNLGNMHGFILADIPGLIEGASEGKGLGHKFLRHIERTKILLHCISLEEDIKKAHTIIRAELKAYSGELAKKPEVLILTKSDSVEEGGLKKKLKTAKSLSKTVFIVSILDDEQVKSLQDEIIKLLSKRS